MTRYLGGIVTGEAREFPSRLCQLVVIDVGEAGRRVAGELALHVDDN